VAGELWLEGHHGEPAIHSASGCTTASEGRMAACDQPDLEVNGKDRTDQPDGNIFVIHYFLRRTVFAGSYGLVRPQRVRTSPFVLVYLLPGAVYPLLHLSPVVVR